MKSWQVDLTISSVYVICLMKFSDYTSLEIAICFVSIFVWLTFIGWAIPHIKRFPRSAWRRIKPEPVTYGFEATSWQDGVPTYFVTHETFPTDGDAIDFFDTNFISVYWKEDDS